MSNSNFKINPFEPDKPAKPTIFAGRKVEIGQIKDALYRTYKGGSRHLLIVGDRGIGKTSLASYTEYLANGAQEIFSDPKARFLTVFVSLGGCRSTDEVCTAILDECNKKLRQIVTLKDKILKLLERVEGINVGWFGIQLMSQKAGVISSKFSTILEEMWDKLKDEYGALLIILDETEYISLLSDFSPFVKSLLEKLDHDGYQKIMFIITASPFALEKFKEYQETFPRVFTHITVPDMAQGESDELVNNALKEGQPVVRADGKFLKSIYHYSSGIPSFIHEIGRAAFDVNTDDVLDWEDFRLGVLGTDRVKGALTSLEDKHFRERYTKRILSNNYREILRIIASYDEDVVSVSKVKSNFKGDKRLVAPYIGIMVRRGILTKVEGRKGEYRLPDRMFKVFLRLSEKRSKEKTAQ